MSIKNLPLELSGNAYPGRGILVGQNPSGELFIGYFIMGRSENSRNRIFVPEGDGIRTQAFDPSKLTDPSLVIYAPVRMLENHLIVTNGDQTDTVYDFMNAGKTFEQALMTREFEPDPPNFTPRISAYINLEPDGFSYKMSILKSTDGDPQACQRFFFNYNPIAGQGHFIHTYKCDGNPRIPTFEGEPGRFLVPDDFEAFTNEIWNSLNEENKVSLFTRLINLKTGAVKTKIINKNQ